MSKANEATPTRQSKTTTLGRRLITRAEAAAYLGVSQATLSRWAADRTGPPFVKLTDSGNGSVRYPSDALDDFLAARTKHPK
jgi:excisionase family DNA binding protein